MKSIVSVVITTAVRKFDKIYQYYVPEKLNKDVNVGVRVIVPFGNANRSVEGYIISINQESQFENLKEIKKIIDKNPILSKELIELAIWMKSRYICTYADAIKIMLPPGLGIKFKKRVYLINNVDGLRGNSKKLVDILQPFQTGIDYEELKQLSEIKNFSTTINSLIQKEIVRVEEKASSLAKEKNIKVAYISKSNEEVIEEIESNRIKKIQQIRVLEMLLENEYIAISDIMRFSNVSKSVLDTLKKYGYIDYKEIEVKRDPLSYMSVEKTYALKPTAEQKIALEKGITYLEDEQFNEMLIRGVTGSGKTEVYLQLIEYCINKGKQAIMLVPEISLTPQIVRRFKGRLGNQVAVLHSKLSLGERYDEWRRIKNQEVKVVVGARSAIFAPLQQLGIIIIDEEHEGTYKAETTPKYCAKEIARQRCIRNGATLIYGSATPSVETFYKAKSHEIDLVEMLERPNNILLPQVIIRDMREELNSGNRSIFSSILEREINNNIKNGEQTVLFLNRRGNASFVLCRNCGLTFTCRNCHVSMTYHSFDDRLICHYCGYTLKNPKECPKCQSSYIKSFGVGTQKIEEEVKKQFENSTVLRMDVDTTNYKNSHDDILNKFQQDNINILIGTQMVAKGHDFPNVTLVGVLAADSLLNIADYRATEKTFQLITQVAGRAGRGKLPGRVIVQTYNTDNFSIILASKHDYIGFYEQEIKLRKMLLYPPFTNIGMATLSGNDDKQVYYKAKQLSNKMKSLLQNEKDAEVLGPTRTPITKIKNKYRWRIVIKCSDLNKIVEIWTKISDEFYGNKNNKMMELSVDINSTNML